MRNMLAIWRAHGLDEILREAWEQGTVLAGLSAGAMCWFEGGITKSSGAPAPVAGLGLLPGSMSVHLDGEPDRRRPYVEAVASGRCPAATPPTTASRCCGRTASSRASSAPSRGCTASASRPTA